ncbi:MAG: 13E12 repeat family protein [Actinomycetota bacterium]|nr:13E12 repeat family protein [Actinomycetota bacterium]
MTAWLGDHAGMAGGDAARVVRSARCLRDLPVTSAAALDATLSAGQVRAIVANVSPAAVELFADHEGDLVPTLAPLSVADVAVAMRTWAALADDALDTGEAAEACSSVFLSSSLEGRWHLDGGLDALSGEILHTALALAKSPDAEGEPSRSPGERRADALVDICSFFLENHEHPAGSRHRPHVNVIVTLGDLQAGRGASAPTAPCWTVPPWPPWCATPPCTGCSWPARCSSTTARRPRPSRPTCTTPWWSGTATADRG